MLTDQTFMELLLKEAKRWLGCGSDMVSVDLRQTELEFRLGTHMDNRFKAEQNFMQFKNVIEHLQKLGFGLVEETTMDLRVHDADNIRLTISSKEEIKRYCQTEDISKITNKIYMTKSKLEKSVDLADYNLRIQLSSEIPVESSVITEFEKKLQSATVKHYRYKHRYSFTDQRKKLRFDLTVVKSGNGVNLKESRTFRSPEHYEVEIEYIGDKQTKMAIADLFDEMTIMMVYKVMSWAQNSFMVVKTSEYQAIYSEYHRMAFGTLQGDRDFIGMDVLPIDKESIAKIEKGYSVTEKADGERYLMMIANTTGMIYLINNRKEIKHTGLRTKFKPLYGSIFDGELVVNKIGSHSYMIFDCLFLNGYDLRGKPLYDEANKNQKIDDINPKTASYRYQAVIWSAQHLDSQVPDTVQLISDINLSINYKKYLFNLPSDKKTIYQLSKEVYDKKDQYPYNLDGIIYTPYQEPYPKASLTASVKWPGLLKWKPLDQLSIDFLVVYVGKQPIIDINTQQRVIKVALKVLRSDQIVDFLPKIEGSPNFNLINLPVDDDGLPRTTRDRNIIYNNSVVEFIYDKTRLPGFKWVPIRDRPDKTHNRRPNAWKTAESTWVIMINPITTEMITGLVAIKVDTLKYYKDVEAEKGQLVESLREYHNRIKSYLFRQVTESLRSNRKDRVIDLLDIACGKAGDLPKWRESRINYVLGIDYSKDGLIDEEKGAFTRMRQNTDAYPVSFGFAWGDSRKFINNGDAGLDQVNKQVLREYLSVGTEARGPYSFDLVSCQFAIHYFMSDQATIDSVLHNVAFNLKIGGYFIGTTLNGRQVFDALLKDTQIKGEKEKQVIWSIDKDYTSDTFEPFGQQIKAYNISIGGDPIPEYLVNFDYLVERAKQHDLEVVTSSEVKGLEGIGSFETLYETILKTSKPKSQVLIKKMSKEEKIYSYMNHYFVFKKVEPTVLEPAPTKVTVHKPRILKKHALAPAPAPAPAPVPAPVPAVVKRKIVMKK